MEIWNERIYNQLIFMSYQLMAECAIIFCLDIGIIAFVVYRYKRLTLSFLTIPFLLSLSILIRLLSIFFFFPYAEPFENREKYFMRNIDLEETFITLSNFFYYIGQWFFGYQYLHVSLVLPRLFNVVRLQNLCKQGSDNLLNLIDENEPQNTKLSLISDENRSSKTKVKQIVKRLDLHIEKAIE